MKCHQARYLSATAFASEANEEERKTRSADKGYVCQEGGADSLILLKNITAKMSLRN